MSFPATEKKSDRFSCKTCSGSSKYLLLVCQILQNFTEGNARKFTVSFAFCAHVDVIKNQKILFSFERAQISKAFVLGARAIVKLW